MKVWALLSLLILCIWPDVASGQTPPFERLIRLTQSDGSGFDQFGYSLKISGDTLIVGASEDDSAGSAYVFERNQGGADQWLEAQYITALDRGANDDFGFSLAIDVDTVAISARGDDDLGMSSGSVYIFGRDQGGVGNWGQVKKIQGSDTSAFDEFGYSLALSGDTLAVGVRLRDKVYIFERNQGGTDNWGEIKILTVSIADAGNWFGQSVSLEGDTLVVGAHLDDDAAVDAGAVYIFERDQGGPDNWGLISKVAPADGTINEQFGVSVSLSGDTLAVGSYFADDAASDAGSVYLLERDQGGLDNWGEVAEVTASDANINDQFGLSAAIDGDLLIAGAWANDDFGLSSGSAYLFARNEGGADNWGEVSKLESSHGQQVGYFGISVAIDDAVGVIGAHGEEAAYIFCANFDGDGVCDDLDLCIGDDSSGDTDGDAVCDDLDLCPGSDDSIDTDGDGVPDGCDICPGSDDNIDTDGDGVPDGCDICPGSDDSIDTDGDGVPDGCDICPGSDDSVDTDGDGVPDGCDICPGADDSVDTDGDGVPDGCDVCPGADDSVDTDGDGVPDGCDACPGSDDSVDTDGDGVPDGCDACPGSDDSVDTDGDGVPDGCDICPGSDDSVDTDGDGVPDGCDVCWGDDASGDQDGDLICADRDCDDQDPTNTSDACTIFADSFESGDTSAWHITQVPDD